ncbi:methyltransferase domain-containing protein [Nonomuraea sp. NPDC002799]
MTDVAGRTEALISEVSALVPDAARVWDTIRAVPRHPYIPRVGQAWGPLGGIRVIDRGRDPGDWWTAVYSDTSIVTQLDDGATDLATGAGDCTSSASAPSTVVHLLKLLDPEPGHRVLEIGTGTGWTAALLSHLVGAANVTSIEVDKTVADQAAGNLAADGVHPHLIVGDGADGCPSRAPFDRVHVTCGIQAVPYAWIEQCRPGAVIVLPYRPGFGTGHALRLIVAPDGRAHGRFPGYADYMMMRSQRRAPGQPARTPEDKHHLTTSVDPRTIAYAPAGADLAIAALTGLAAHGSAEPDEDGELYRLWLSDPADSYSWAVVDWRPGEQEYEVYQVGDRPLWDEVTDAYFRWVSWGEPGRDRFGMTVTPDGRHIWLDSPTTGSVSASVR